MRCESGHHGRCKAVSLWCKDSVSNTPAAWIGPAGWFRQDSNTEAFQPCVIHIPLPHSGSLMVTWIRCHVPVEISPSWPTPVKWTPAFLFFFFIGGEGFIYLKGNSVTRFFGHWSLFLCDIRINHGFVFSHWSIIDQIADYHLTHDSITELQLWNKGSQMRALRFLFWRRLPDLQVNLLWCPFQITRDNNYA